MKVCAIVPVRALEDGKTRLSAVLSPPQRAGLVQSMLQRVLDALRAAPGVTRIVVVTADASLAPAGVEIVRDRGEGLNEALALGLAQAATNAEAALIVAADAPRLTAAEIGYLIDSARDAEVAIVPDRHCAGTNALWLRLPARIVPQFGADSLAAHLAAARAAGVKPRIVELPGLSQDVDVPDDLPYAAPSTDEARALAADGDLAALLRRAAALTERGFGRRVSCSPKVFIPLTQLCRDVCHYCTFAGRPRKGRRAFLTPDAVLQIAREGVAAGCSEALFTLGDQPEARYRVAREELAALGFETTLAYLAHCAGRVFEETGLLPHLNPGVMSREALLGLRAVSVSMGMMLETSAERLAARGGPHHRSPDKQPSVRLATLQAAGEAGVPFTTGLLIGIGETRLERIDALLAIRALHERHGHVQELIIQNFRAKPGTRMALHPEPTLEELQWTIAAARVLFGPSMSIQAPPNLSPGRLAALLDAGVNDWGGVSPVTPDYVNPEAPWPPLEALARDTAAAGRWLVERLPIVPSFATHSARWVAPALRTAVLHGIDADGYRRDPHWHAGAGEAPPPRYLELMQGARRRHGRSSGSLRSVLRAAQRGAMLDLRQVVSLFAADGEDFAAVIGAADELRAATVGESVGYVVNRNINYTNICTYSCGFCAFAKGRSARSLRGPGYDLDLGEIERRVREAVERGASEVCLQGGIHPRYTGDTYLQIVHAALRGAAGVHVHAFSPLEISHGAATLELPLREYLARLREAGLRTLPGTAAEILCDDVRAVICPDKLDSGRWLEVMRAAHSLGMRSTATIMFGHVERTAHWARHLLAIRALQMETGGFTEFVPLPFVHMEAPLWRAGRARSGPGFREAMLMHAVARLALHPVLQNVQASWVKLGRDGAVAALTAGANDLGGVLMDESITRAAGGVNGQEMNAAAMQAAIRSAGREPWQRTTLYGHAAPAGAARAVPAAAQALAST